MEKEGVLSTYQIHSPRHIKEAVEMMTRLENANYIGHGTKLLPLIEQKKLAPHHLISLDGVGDVKNITKLNGVRLGSGLTFNEIRENDLVRKRYTAIYDALSSVPAAKKKDGGTLGGDLCSAYPYALMACPMMVFDAEVAAAGMYPATHSSGTGVKGGFFGSRMIRMDSFFAARDKTILKQDEVVKEFALPSLPENTGSAYIKIGRKNEAMLGVAGVCARVTVDSKGGVALAAKAVSGKEDLADILSVFNENGLTCTDARLVVAFSRDVSRRLSSGEDELKGNRLSWDIFDNAIRVAAKSVMARTKGKTEAWYGQEIVTVLLKRCIMRAIDRAIRPEVDVRPEGAW